MLKIFILFLSLLLLAAANSEIGPFHRPKPDSTWSSTSRSNSPANKQEQKSLQSDSHVRRDSRHRNINPVRIQRYDRSTPGPTISTLPEITPAHLPAVEVITSGSYKQERITPQGESHHYANKYSRHGNTGLYHEPSVPVPTTSTIPEITTTHLPAVEVKNSSSNKHERMPLQVESHLNVNKDGRHTVLGPVHPELSTAIPPKSSTPVIVSTQPSSPSTPATQSPPVPEHSSRSPNIGKPIHIRPSRHRYQPPTTTERIMEIRTPKQAMFVKPEPVNKVKELTDIRPHYNPETEKKSWSSPKYSVILPDVTTSQPSTQHHYHLHPTSTTPATPTSTEEPNIALDTQNFGSDVKEYPEISVDLVTPKSTIPNKPHFVYADHKRTDTIANPAQNSWDIPKLSPNSVGILRASQPEIHPVFVNNRHRDIGPYHRRQRSSNLPVRNTSSLGRTQIFKCPEKYGYFIHSNRCDEYVECKNDVPIMFTCPAGLHFNPAAKWTEYPCDQPSVAKCNPASLSQTISTTPAPTVTTPHPAMFSVNFTCPQPNGYFENAKQCSQYIECKNYKPLSLACPIGFQFNVYVDWTDYPCDHPSKVQCNKQDQGVTNQPTHITATPPTPVVTSYKPYFPTQPTVITTTHPSDRSSYQLEDYYCQEANAYYSVASECDKYIECKSYIAVQHYCPDGLHFNSKAKWPNYPCDSPSKVQCNRGHVINNPYPNTNTFQSTARPQLPTVVTTRTERPPVITARPPPPTVMTPRTHKPMVVTAWPQPPNVITQRPTAVTAWPQPPNVVTQRPTAVTAWPQPPNVITQRPTTVAPWPQPSNIVTQRPTAVTAWPQPPNFITQRPTEVTAWPQPPNVVTQRPTAVTAWPQPPNVVTQRPTAVTVWPQPPNVVTQRPTAVTAWPQLPSISTPRTQRPHVVTAWPQPSTVVTPRTQRPTVTTARPPPPTVLTPRTQQPAVVTAWPQPPTVTTPRTQRPTVTTARPPPPTVLTPRTQQPTVVTAWPKPPTVVTPRPQQPAVVTAWPQPPTVVTPRPKQPAVVTAWPQPPTVVTPPTQRYTFATRRPQPPTIGTPRSTIQTTRGLRTTYETPRPLIRTTMSPKDNSIITTDVLPPSWNQLFDYKCPESNGFYAVASQCDVYVECKSDIAIQHTCPDGLHFNSKARWPEYPCGYPSEVECKAGDVIQEPRPTGGCPRRNGFFPTEDGDCGSYLVCHAGVAILEHCPAGLVFNFKEDVCDWPVNVPECNRPPALRGFICPEARADAEDGMIFKYRQGRSCREFIACQEGQPRLLSCDAGLAFDEKTESCVIADLVHDCDA